MVPWSQISSVSPPGLTVVPVLGFEGVLRDSDDGLGHIRGLDQQVLRLLREGGHFGGVKALFRVLFRFGNQLLLLLFAASLSSTGAAAATERT